MWLFYIAIYPDMLALINKTIWPQATQMLAALPAVCV